MNIEPLQTVLSKKECESVISWMPAGNAFCVFDPNELVEKVLSKYFKETKYSSFVSTQFVLS